MKDRMHRLVRPILLMLLVLTAVPTGAQEARRPDKQKAREHFLEAEAHYKLGRFGEALEEYSRAYEAAPLPAFLFNIGQCHRQMGNHERAIFFYKGYLRERPEARNKAVVEKLIQQCNQELERLEAEARAEAQRKEQLRLEQEERRLEEEKRKAKEREQQLAMERARIAALTAKPPPPPPAPTPIYREWWFWTIVGGAAVVIAGGTALALSSSDTTVYPSGSLGTVDLRGP
jgi:tetratricopeptide (TPR) repeat protein